MRAYSYNEINESAGLGVFKQMATDGYAVMKMWLKEDKLCFEPYTPETKVTPEPAPELPMIAEEEKPKAKKKAKHEEEEEL